MDFLYHQMSVFREQNGLFRWGWLTPCSLQQEIRWVFAATWWNDCIFSVRGPQGDSERHTSIFSHCLTTFFSLCVFSTHTAWESVTVWACAAAEKKSVFPIHPVDVVQKIFSRLDSLPQGLSVSTVIHRALTSKDRDCSATGSPSLQNPQLINFDCFLWDPFL